MTTRLYLTEASEDSVPPRRLRYDGGKPYVEVAISEYAPPGSERVETPADIPTHGTLVRTRKGLYAVPTDGRALADLPDNAVSIASPSDAPPGANVVRGPQGGLYYIPGGGGGGGEDGDGDGDGGEDPDGDEDEETPGPNPERDIEEFIASEEMDEKVSALHDEQYVNGFTLNSDLSEYDGEGFVATVTSANFSHPDAGGEGVSKEDITEMYETMLPVLEAFPERAKLGTFYGDDGYMSVDLNIVADDREVAVAIGEANNQQAVWDIGGEAPIPTGGDGNSPVDGDDPEAVREFIEGVIGETREAKGLEGVFGGGGEPVTAYTVKNAEGEAVGEVSGIELFGKVKSGVWDITDSTEEGVVAVATTDGDELLLEPSAGDGGDEGNLNGGRKAAHGDGPTSPFEASPADDYTEAERAFHAMYEGVIWDEEATDRELYAAQRLPEAAKERLTETIQEGALLDSFETITSKSRGDLREWLLDRARDDGWTMRGFADRLQGIDPGLSDHDAERIARTETQAIVTDARERWYAEEFPDDGDLFIWQGPQDDRTTDACTEAKERTNPEYGGEPVSLSELKDVVADVARKHFPGLSSREWTVHPHERHTIVRWYGR
jgi:hypothetical protein